MFFIFTLTDYQTVWSFVTYICFLMIYRLFSPQNIHLAIGQINFELNKRHKLSEKHNLHSNSSEYVVLLFGLSACLKD